MVAENSAGKQRGKPFAKGTSGNPAGKPKGARHRATRAVEKLLDGEAEEITRKCIEKAKEGDSVALRLCMERIAPLRKGRPVSLALPAVNTAEQITAALGAVTQAMASGDLTPEEAAAIAGVLDQNRKAVETEQLAQRITTLEARDANRGIK